MTSVEQKMTEILDASNNESKSASIIHHKHSQDWEFLILPSTETKWLLSPNYVLKQLLLFSHSPKRLEFSFPENANSLTFLEHFSVDELNLMDHKQKQIKGSKIEIIDNITSFKQIEIQYHYHQCAPGHQLHEYKINYIKFTKENGESISFGEKRMKKDNETWPIKEKMQEKYYYILEPVIFISDNIIICGILLDNWKVLGFQCVSFNGKYTFNKLINMFKHENEDGNNMTQGLHITPIDIEHFYVEKNYYGAPYHETAIFNAGLIGIENGYLLHIIDLLYMRNRKWTSDPAAFILPYFVNITNQCITDNDLKTIHSILSLQRYLNTLIQNKNDIINNKCKLIGKSLAKYGKDQEDKVKLFESIKDEHFWAYLVKLKKYWDILSDIAILGKSIYFYGPKFDVYNLSHLKSSKQNMNFSKFTFFTQILLFTVLCLWLIYEIVSFDVNERLNFDDIEAASTTIFKIVLSVLTTIMVYFMVKQSTDSTKSFYNVFPDDDIITNKMSRRFAFIANVYIATLIVPINFCVIFLSETLFDVVFNAIAVLFILEIDNQVVDIGANDEKAIFLSYAQKLLQKGFNEINIGYKGFGIHFMKYFYDRIDIKNCEVQFGVDSMTVNDDNYFLIVNGSTGKILQFDNNNNTIKESINLESVENIDDNGNAKYLFKLHLLSNGYYNIQCVSNNLFWQIPQQMNDDKNIISAPLFAIDDNDETQTLQQFIIVYQGGNNYDIFNVNSRHKITIDIDAKILTQIPSGKQLWKLVKKEDIKYERKIDENSDDDNEMKVNYSLSLRFEKDPPPNFKDVTDSYHITLAEIRLYDVNNNQIKLEWNNKGSKSMRIPEEYGGDDNYILCPNTGWQSPKNCITMVTHHSHNAWKKCKPIHNRENPLFMEFDIANKISMEQLHKIEIINVVRTERSLGLKIKLMMNDEKELWCYTIEKGQNTYDILIDV